MLKEKFVNLYFDDLTEDAQEMLTDALGEVYDSGPNKIEGVEDAREHFGDKPVTIISVGKYDDEKHIMITEKGQQKIDLYFETLESKRKAILEAGIDTINNIMVVDKEDIEDAIFNDICTMEDCLSADEILKNTQYITTGFYSWPITDNLIMNEALQLSFNKGELELTAY